MIIRRYVPIVLTVNFNPNPDDVRRKIVFCEIRFVAKCPVSGRAGILTAV